MPVDTGFLGQNAYIKFGSTELQIYYRNLGGNEEGDLVECSSGSDRNKLYLGGQKDGSKDLEIVMPAGTAGTALYAAVTPLTAGTLEWGPEGTASGKARHYVNAIVKSRGEPLKYNDLTTLSVTFQYNGAVTDSVYPA